MPTTTDNQIINLRNQVTSLKLRLDRRHSMITQGLDSEQRERITSEIASLTVQKQEIEARISALDLQQRRAAAKEERRRMDLERATQSGEFE